VSAMLIAVPLVPLLMAGVLAGAAYIERKWL
jgi:hypothetical protein